MLGTRAPSLQGLRAVARALSTLSDPAPLPAALSTTEMPEAAQLCPKARTHEELYRFSIKQPEAFWSGLARSRLQWDQDFHTGMDCSMESGQFGWFLGGKLNVSVNCVDRWAAVAPDRVALVWERDEPGEAEQVTYAQLLDMVCRVANVLAGAGVGKGDVVALYMPVCPLAVATMLATARIGAIHNVVFAGFSAEALGARIRDAGARVVVTADEAVRGGRRIPLKATVDKAVAEVGGVDTVLVMRRTGAPVPMAAGRDEWLEEAMAAVPGRREPLMVDSEHPLFLLYTSGSTGKPKGVSASLLGLCSIIPPRSGTARPATSSTAW
jgi:acetyl-CoA synthetase